jgi:hypothetical protein
LGGIWSFLARKGLGGGLNGMEEGVGRGDETRDECLRSRRNNRETTGAALLQALQLLTTIKLSSFRDFSTARQTLDQNGLGDN